MKSNRILMAAVAAVVLVLSGLSTPARGDPAGNAVTEWNTIAVNTLIGLPGPAGGAPPAAQVHVAMVQGAVYDAVNATEPKHYRPYLLNRRFSARASQDAAVATAAYGVLRSIVATVPNLADDGPSDPAAVAGHAVRELARRGSEQPVQGPGSRRRERRGRRHDRRPPGRRTLRALAVGAEHRPGSLVAAAERHRAADPRSHALGGDGGALRHADLLAVPHLGPLALTSPAWAREFNEVKAIGAINSTLRTPTQTYIARWWQSTPVASWNEVARNLSLQDGLSIADTARLLAMENLSGADAAINCWNDKYYWDFWRPWNAIPRAAEDGNPDTAPDAGWLPLISAPYPDHPSGHLCLDSAHSRVLQMFFGDAITGGFQMSSISTLLGPADARTRTFGSFSQVLAEVTEARIWAGLHYRTADEQAKGLGWNVADYLAANYFQPVGRAH